MIWDWLSPDRLDLFEKNYNQYNNESLIYYKENPIKYRLNNYGFRSHDDFDDINEGNIFLGCSHTLGVGHHLENTWAYKLNEYCLLYTSPSPRDGLLSRMPSSA